MIQKVPNRSNKLENLFLDIAHSLITRTKEWKCPYLEIRSTWSILKHLKYLKHFLRICSETSKRSTLIFSMLLININTFIRKLKLQPLPFIGFLQIFGTFLRCSCKRIRIYSYLQDMNIEYIHKMTGIPGNLKKQS